MLKLKLQYFGHLMWRTDSLKKTLMLGKFKGRRRRGQQRMRQLMASPTQWTWVWASCRSWWWTGKPGVLQSMGWQSWTQLSNWTGFPDSHSSLCVNKVTEIFNRIKKHSWGGGGRFKREGTYVYLRLIRVDVWQKPTQYCKAIILQLKITKRKSCLYFT